MKKEIYQEFDILDRDITCDHKFNILDRDITCDHKFNRYNTLSSVTFHNHDGYEILLFLDGEDVNFLVESDGKVLERGDLIFISSYAFHGLRISDTSRYERIVLNVREPYLQSLNDKYTDLSLCFHRMPATHLNIIHLSESEIERYMSLAENLEKAIPMQDYGHTILIRAFLSELMVLVNQYAKTFNTPLYSNIMPSVVTKTFEFVEENITSDITIESLAEQFHYNSDYLSRAFKAATGSSLKHYINAKKITLAQQYLRQGLPPLDVCFMIGYNNYSSFSRRFSEHTGLSPRQYQLSCRIPHT